MSARLEAAAAVAQGLAQSAVFELKATDDGMSGGQSAKLLAGAVFQVLRALEGDASAADYAYRLADLLATGGPK